MDYDVTRRIKWEMNSNFKINKTGANNGRDNRSDQFKDNIVPGKTTRSSTGPGGLRRASIKFPEEGNDDSSRSRRNSSFSPDSGQELSTSFSEYSDPQAIKSGDTYEAYSSARAGASSQREVMENEQASEELRNRAQEISSAIDTMLSNIDMKDLPEGTRLTLTEMMNQLSTPNLTGSFEVEKFGEMVNSLKTFYSKPRNENEWVEADSDVPDKPAMGINPPAPKGEKEKEAPLGGGAAYAGGKPRECLLGGDGSSPKDPDVSLCNPSPEPKPVGDQTPIGGEPVKPDKPQDTPKPPDGEKPKDTGDKPGVNKPGKPSGEDGKKTDDEKKVKEDERRKAAEGLRKEKKALRDSEKQAKQDKILELTREFKQVSAKLQNLETELKGLQGRLLQEIEDNKDDPEYNPFPLQMEIESKKRDVEALKTEQFKLKLQIEHLKNEHVDEENFKVEALDYTVAREETSKDRIKETTYQVQESVTQSLDYTEEKSRTGKPVDTAKTYVAEEKDAPGSVKVQQDLQELIKETIHPGEENKEKK